MEIYNPGENNAFLKLSKSYCFIEILSFLTDAETLRLQLLCQHFYHEVMPRCLFSWRVKQEQCFEIFDFKNNKVSSFDIKKEKWVSSSTDHIGFSLSGGHKTWVQNNRVFLLGGVLNEKDDAKVPFQPSPTFEFIRDALPNKQFVRMANMNWDRNYFACAGVKDRIYAIGGKSMDGAYLKSIEYYSIFENRWVMTKFRLNYARVFGSAICVKNSRIYIIGGTKQSDSVEWFDIDQEGDETKGTIKWNKFIFEHGFYMPYFQEICINVKNLYLSQLCTRKDICSSESVSESSESDIYSEDSDEEAEFNFEDNDTFLEDAVIVLRKKEIFDTNSISKLNTFFNDFTGYIMDFENKAIYDLPLNKWKKETCEYVGDSYYNQYYFKMSDDQNQKLNEPASHLGLHDYSKQTDKEYYYLCGGSYVHKINFHNQEWKLLAKGSDQIEE